MGGGDEATASVSTPDKSQGWPEATVDVIDQTVNDAPERSSTPPDYKPNTTPPVDPESRVVP